MKKLLLLVLVLFYTVSFCFHVNSQMIQKYEKVGYPNVPTNGIYEKTSYIYEINMNNTVLPHIHNKNKDYVTFILTTFSGDTDLFISNSKIPDINYSKRECLNCLFASKENRGKIIHLSANDTKFPSNKQDSFFVAVVGYTRAFFNFNFIISTSKYK
jgi:hypothetical protein